MKGIIFAAGLGTRLKPFTDLHPKALADVGGKPALQRVIERLVDGGASGIVINAHHFAEQIVSFIDSHDFGVPVEISVEKPLLLDTAGGLAKIYRESNIIASAEDDEAIIVHNADIITDFPLNDIVASLANGDVAILVNPGRQTNRRFLFDTSLRLRGWQNINTGAVRPEGLINDNLFSAAFGGVHAMYKHALGAISNYVGTPLKPAGITDFYIANSNRLVITAFIPKAAYRWFDIGTPERLSLAAAQYT